MDSLDSYTTVLVNRGSGEDEKGKYIIKEVFEEIPCMCCEETCMCGGRETIRSSYKQYENGETIGVL